MFEDLDRLLDEQGVRIIDPTSGRTSLHKAASSGSISLVSRIMQDSPDLLDIPDKKGYSPFHLSIVSQRFELSLHLLETYNPSLKNSIEGECTPLYSTILRAYIQISPKLLHLLVERTFSIFPRDSMEISEIMKVFCFRYHNLDNVIIRKILLLYRTESYYGCLYNLLLEHLPKENNETDAKTKAILYEKEDREGKPVIFFEIPDPRMKQKEPKAELPIPPASPFEDSLKDPSSFLDL